MKTCLLILVFCAIQARVLTSSLCSSYCKDDDILDYKLGYTYIYKYTGSINSLVYKNSSEQHDADNPSFIANLKLIVLSPCDFELKISSVEVQNGKDGNFEKSLVKYPLQFSFKNGKITSICPSAEEMIPILNIKRGILSSFQTNFEQGVIFETDVIGTCETKYEHLQNGDVKKTKDLTSCNKRSTKQFSWHSEVYNKNQAKFSSPLLRSTQNCVQKFHNKIIHNVECVENHLFRPFSNGGNGAKTTLKQQLQYIKSYNTLNHLRQHFECSRSSLIFEKQPEKTMKNNIDDVEVFEELMHEIETKTRNGIQKDVPELFSRLVDIIENSKEAPLLSFFRKVKHSNHKKKFFVDAVSVTKSIESVEIMKKLYEDKEIPQSLFISWLRSLGFMKNPTKEYIYSLYDLLDLGHPVKQKVYLSISGLIHQYCKNNICDEEFGDILEKMSKSIRYKCAPISSDHQDDILLTLKAIGNAGHPYFGQYLKKCYSNTDVPIDLKIAAIQAHRRMSCEQNQNVKDFEKIFSDFKENSELRINAYLAMMQCLSYSTIGKIKLVLDEEETNQVGSFVWSHLVNLQKTETFWKQDFKRMVENESWKNKFSTDPRKYSRNYEASTFFNQIDTGIGLESNVIFTQESYLPKSAILNFTVDIFGETINLFEVGGRMEGFEDIVENIFGPNGYFPEQSIKTFLENQRNEHELFTLKINNKNTLQKSPIASFYTKIFGQEITFGKLQNLEEILGKPSDIYGLLHSIIGFFKGIDYSKSMKFLDSTYQVPTILGFPLELSVNGTAILGFTTKGKVNVAELKNYKFEIEGEISPSASIKVIGNMDVDAYFTKIGLKSISTLNSNTFIGGSIKIDQGKLVDIKINTPTDDVDIINIESEVFLMKDGQLQPLEDISKEGTDRSDCTGSYFEHITGLQICHNLKYVNASSVIDAPYFPLTGSFKYGITLKKKDTFDSYILKWTSQKDYEQGIYGFSFDLDTPKSLTNRKLNAFFLLDVAEKVIELKMSSRFVSFDLLGKIDLDPRKFTISLRHSYNREEVLNFQAILSYVAPKYNVNIALNFKKRQLFSLHGHLTPTPAEVTSKFYVKIKKKHIIMDSSLKIKDDSYHLSSVIKDGHTNDTKGDLTVQFLYDPRTINLVADAKYWISGKEESVSLKFNAWKGATLDYRTYGVYLKFDMSQKPEYNTLIDIETRKAYLHYDIKGVINIFGKKWETRQLLKFLRQYNNIDASIVSSLSCPDKNIDYIFMLTYNTSYVQDFAKILMQLNPVQRLEAVYNFQTKMNGDRNLDILFYIPRNSYTIKGEIKNIGMDEYSIKLLGEKEMITKELFLEVNGTYMNSTKDNLQNYSLNGKLNLENGFFKSPWNFKTNFQIADNLLATHIDIEALSNKLLTQLSWTQNTFNANFEFNTKKVFFTNLKWNHEVNFAVGLNIYQNFELDVTFQPKTKMDVVFYWDKDNDLTRKVYLNLQNFGGGIYTMELEYPNQKVTASFTLQSTQITLNITWGLETYQKIYLNVGSKVYDLGGIWYGELETPFKYFEKQQFNIKYLIMQNSVNVEVKVFWREHRIDFGLSGSRSAAHINGKLEMRTTLPEIYKVGLGVSYIERENLGAIEKIGNISMIYNDHKIHGYNRWAKKGMNIDVKFELVSPSKTLKPIFGNMEIRNNETNSRMNSLISWQEKEIIVNYKVENTSSSILIKTPFEGMEKTKFQYSLIRTTNDLLIEVEIDILNQLNYAFLRWSNEYNNTYNVEFEITSPLTGRYQLFFKHSTHHGYLMENLIINHGENNNTIFGVQINGNVVSVWNVDLRWSMKFLNHNATLSIQNNVNPFTSIVEARWDNLTISSNLEVVFTPYKLVKAFWLVRSSVLEQDFEIFYTSYDKYHLSIKIPHSFFLENNLEVLGDDLIGHFVFKTPTYSGKILFKHLPLSNISYHDHVKFIFEGNELMGDLKYKFDELAIFDQINMKIRSSWSDNVDLNYTLNKSLTNNRISLKPTLFARYNNHTVHGSSNFEISPWDFSINLNINGTDISPFNLVGQCNKKERNFEFQVKSDIIEGHISLNKNKNIFLVNLKSNFFYFNPNLSESQLLLKIQMDDERPFEMYFKSNLENWENVHLRLVALDDLDGFRNGVFTLKKNNETTALNYKFNKINYDGLKIKFEVNVSSNVEYLNNSLLIIDTDYTKIYLKAKVHIYKTEIGYLSNFKDTSTSRGKGFENSLKILLYFGINGVNITDIHFDAKSKFVNQKGDMVFSLNLIGNKSKLDVELSKKNWKELSLKSFSILDENIFVGTNFSYKLVQNRFDVFCDTKSTYGNFSAKIEIGEDVQKIKKITTYIEYKKDNAEYLGKITTKYNNILWSDSELEFQLPKETYKGNLKIEIGDISNTFIASLSSPQNSNKVECVLNVYSIKKANGIFDFHLDLFETTSSKFTFDYDMESSDKKLAFNYHPDFQTVEAIKLQLTLNRSDININFDLPHHKKYVYLNGRNLFKDKEVSLVYQVKYSNTVLKIDVFYINKSYTQTKLEMSSNIKGYERIIFENRIDDNKIRIFIHGKFHRLSIIADKTALRQDKELFSIYYNNEPVVVIRSDNDQSYLMASSNYSIYKLTVNYVHDPAIFTFSILKNGENLISFMLLNTSTSRIINYKGKLAAPILFPKHPEVLFNVIANYDIAKLLHFTIMSDNKNIFEMKWSSKLERGLYEAYFKYSSEMPLVKLKKFEIYPSLNMWNDFSVKINYVENGENLGFFTELAIPLKTLDTKFIVEYPCSTNQCKYYFYVNRTYVDINWRLPIQNMNNVKFNINLNKYNAQNFSVGEVIFEKDENKVEAGWLLGINDLIDKSLRIYLNSNINNAKTQQDIYYNSNATDKILNINLDNFKTLFTCKKDVDKLVKLTITDETTILDIEGIISDEFIKYVFNNSAIITNLTINRNENFDMRIVSEYVNFPEILNNGEENTLFHKLIMLSQFLTVPFVGKDIQVKTMFEKENFEINATVITSNDVDTYNFKKAPDELLFVGPNIKIKGLYKNLNWGLYEHIQSAEFSVDGFNKTLILKFHRREGYVDSQILINNNSSLNINLYFGYEKMEDTYLIRTNIPISLNEYIRSNTALTFENNYSLEQTILFPNSNNVSIISKAAFLTNHSFVDIHMLSTFGNNYHGMITYDINKNDIHLAILSSLGDRNITITSHIALREKLSIILRTPYSGFHSASLEAKYNEINKKASLHVLKENFVLNLEGLIERKTNSLYELNMISTNSQNDSLTSVRIKLDQKIMKFNADVIWNATKFQLDLNYNPRNYKLDLTTPFENFKILQLTGIYLKNDTWHTLEGNGNWDDTSIIYAGNLNLKPENFKLKSGINIGGLQGDLEINISKDETEKIFAFFGHYPKPANNVFLTLKSRTDGLNLINELSLKTTFANLKNVTIALVKNQSGVNIRTLANIMQKDLLVDVTAKIDNNTIQVNSNVMLLNNTVTSELYLDIFRMSYFKMDNFYIQYDLEDKYLFKVIFVDTPIIFEVAYQDGKAELFAQMRNTLLETSYTLWKEFKCHTKNNLISYNIYISKDNLKFLRNHLTGHYLEFVYLNNFEIFQLGFVDSGYDLVYNFEAYRNLSKLIFQYDKLLFVHYDHNKEDRLFIFHAQDYLDTKYNSSKLFIEFNGNFPILNDVNIVSKLHRERLFAETIFIFDRNHQNLIRFKEFHDSTRMGIVFEFDNIYVKLNHEYLNSKMTVHIKKDFNEISYEFSDLGTLRLMIKNAFLENNGFVLSTNVKLPLNASFALSTIDNKVIAKFDSYANPNSFCLDFKAPNNQILSFVRFETSWGNEIFKTLNNIKIESTKLGNVSIVGNFDLKIDGLDIETHLRMPFLENFEKLDGEVHIHKNLTPWLYITLPNDKTYSIKAIYIDEPDTFKIDLGFHSADKMYGFKIDYHKDNTFIASEIITPFEGYRHYGFGFEKDNNVNLITLNINERIYNLNTKSIFTNKLQMLTLNLETPFQNYERYYLEIEHEDSVFNCFVFYPGLKRLIGFGFNTKVQFSVSFKISLPYPVHDFEHSAFEIKIIPSDSGLYNISAMSELNDKYVKLNFVMNNNSSHIYSVLETNNNKIVYKMHELYENYIVYNNNYIYNYNFYNSLHFYVDFYYRKMSFTYDTYNKNFQVKMWDPEDHNNKYGGHFIKYLENGVNETSIGLYLPSKILVLDQRYFKNDTNLLYSAKIFWNEEKMFGFKGEFSKINTQKLIDFNSKLNIFIPNRELELDQHLKLHVNAFEPLNGIVNIYFKWDDNEESQISYKGILSERHLESVFSGFFCNDIIFRIDFTKLNDLPFGFVFEIEYSDDEEKTIHLEMFYNKIYINNVTIDERRFVLRQPYSYLDHTLISKTVTCEKYTNITAVIQYTDFAIKKPDYIKVSWEIGREQFEISGAVESKKNLLAVHGKSITDLYSKGLELKIKINNKEPLNFNYLYVYDDNAPSFKLRAGYGDERYYNFYMGIPSRKEIIIQLIHNIYGRETVDGLVAFKLNTTSLLWTKILWKPNVLRQFYKTIIQEYAEMKYVVQVIGKQLIDVIHDDTGTILLEEYSDVKEIILRDIDVEITKIVKDFQNLQRLCNNNVLYCQDVLHLATLWSNSIFGNITTPIFNVIKDFYNNVCLIKNKAIEVFTFALSEMEMIFGEIKNIKELKDTARCILSNSFEDAKISLNNMKDTAVKLLEDFQNYLLSVKSVVEDIFKPALDLIGEFWMYVEHQTTYVQIIVLDTIENIQTYISQLKEVKEGILIYNKITTWISTLNPIDLLAPVWEILEMSIDSIIGNINYFCDEYLPSLSSLRTFFFDEHKLPLPKIKDIKDLAENTYQKSAWIWNYCNVTETVKHYIVTKTATYFQMFIKNVFGNTKEGLGIFDYIYNPDEGVIEVSQRLPVEWESFDKSPKFEQHPLYNHIFEKISSFTLDRFETILAKIQMYIYTILNTTIKPPSNNVAMIIRNTHFITFNNKHFDFTGDCSYLLINNFDTDSFSVVFNPREKSLTITTYNDSAVINMSEDVPIVFNSKSVEFPLIHENFFILREEETIVFSNHQGLSIMCNLHYDYCTFKVSEWLFGKIGGMLGKMDNEPSTDMKKPNGSNIVDVDDFAESWRAGQCPNEDTITRNITENVKIPTFVNRAMNTICSQTFLISNSTLSPCFSILDPKPFYELCLNGVRTNSKSVCSSIAAYKQMCNHKHIVVKMPNFCVNCNLDEEGADFEDERIFDGHNSKTIDVVFIQEQGCVPNVNDLRTSLDQALNQNGFTDNRFSFVIYGGAVFAKPFLSTVNGNIWTTGTLPIHNLTHLIRSTLAPMKESNVEEAIRFATRLEFRPAVTKMFVLVQCEMCSEMAHSPELYNLLGEKDVSLHIIKPDPFEPKDLFALDFAKHRVDYKGILKEFPTNERIIESLNDMCCGLAISTNGTVSKRDIFTRHMQKWSELVANTARQCSCQKCKCIQKMNGVGKTDCNRCMSPLVKQLLNEYESQHDKV